MHMHMHMHMHMLRLGLLLSFLFLCSFISSTSGTVTDPNDIVIKFKAAREARKNIAQVPIASDREAGAVEFETRRAALLAQAAQNAPLERDVEWEQQLLEDRRSVHFSRDRSIMDDDTSIVTTTQTYNMAGIKPAEL